MALTDPVSDDVTRRAIARINQGRSAWDAVSRKDQTERGTVRWEKTQFSRKRYHRSGDSPQFRPGVRGDTYEDPKW